MFCQFEPKLEMLAGLTSFILVCAYVVLQIGMPARNPLYSAMYY